MPVTRRGLSEREFQQQVTDLAELRHWDWFHIRSARTADSWRTPVSGTMGAGFPDLLLARPPRLLAIELKTDKGKLTPEQEVWLWTLRDCGVEADCWRPRDWPEIEAVLG